MPLIESSRDAAQKAEAQAEVATIAITNNCAADESMQQAARLMGAKYSTYVMKLVMWIWR